MPRHPPGILVLGPHHVPAAGATAVRVWWAKLCVRGSVCFVYIYRFKTGSVTFTCVVLLCGLGSDARQCRRFTFCGGLVSSFTASCGFQGWVSSGLWCGIQQPVLVSVSGDVLCTSSCHSVCSDIWGSGSVHWASCKVRRGGQEAALQRLHLVSVWRRGHPAAECSW